MQVIHDWQLVLMVLVMVVIDLIILVVYTAVEGSRGNLEAVRHVDQENPVETEDEVMVDFLASYILVSFQHELYSQRIP